MTDTSAPSTPHADNLQRAVTLLERIRLIALGWFLASTLWMLIRHRPTPLVDLLEYGSHAAFGVLMAVVLGSWCRAHAPTPRGQDARVAWRALQVAAAASTLVFLGVIAVHAVAFPPRALLTVLSLIEVFLVASLVALAVGAIGLLNSVARGGAELARPKTQVFARVATVFAIVGIGLHILRVVRAIDPDVVVQVFLMSTLGLLSFFVATRGLQRALLERNRDTLV